MEITDTLLLLSVVQGVGFNNGGLSLIVCRAERRALREVEVTGDVQMEAVNKVETVRGVVNYNGGWSVHSNIFPGLGLFGEGSCLAKVLEIVRKSDFQDGLLKGRQEVILVRFLLKICVLLMPSLLPADRFVFEADGDFGDPVFSIATKLFQLCLESLYPQRDTLLQSPSKVPSFTTQSCCAT